MQMCMHGGGREGGREKERERERVLRAREQESKRARERECERVREDRPKVVSYKTRFYMISIFLHIYILYLHVF